jgi:2-polyprenyl-6-methoxyphenol hydroxylase-like FAD-dependent oxidoreductase
MRHAEIAGGGIGGLAMATLLARDGWSVRLHERHETIREIGAGIYIKNNSIEVLEHLGAFARMRPYGTELQHAQIRFADGSVRQQRTLAGLSRVHVFPRQAVVEALRDCATAAGVEVRTSSLVVSAAPDGTLVTSDGARHKADLVVAADGVNSVVRTSLGIRSRFKLLPTIIDRYLVESREFTREPMTVEHWSGNRRIGVTPSGPEHTYVYMVAPERDAVAKRVPIDVDDWTRRFPQLGGLLALLGRSECTQFNYGLVDCADWSRGRVAILGDAAHGLPPTLGQGAGLTLINAYALAHFLRQGQDVATALARWEKEVRFISDRTQTWACRYDWFTRQWPTRLDVMRPLATWAFGRIPFLNERMRIADQALRPAHIDIARA